MRFPVQYLRNATVAAGLLLCLGGIGCKQVSHFLRSDPVTESDLIPPSPELGPIPQSQTPEYVPPPAPPTESVGLGISVDFWDQVDPELAAREDAEYFPAATPAIPPSFQRERDASPAGRRGEQDRIASARRDWERQHQLPIIVPAAPQLTRVSREEPALLPVPNGRR